MTGYFDERWRAWTGADHKPPSIDDVAVPDIPTVDHESAQARASTERMKAKRGRASTILTGGEGVSSEATSIGVKRLLGQ